MARYEEAYCTALDRLVAAEELERFPVRYLDGLYCPECRAAKLNIANGRLITAARAVHRTDCMLDADLLSQRQILALLDRPEGKAQIKWQLDKLMSGCGVDIAPQGEMPKRCIPRKRLTLPFRAEDWDTIKLFYGVVDVVWSGFNRNTRYELAIYLPDSAKSLCRVMLAESVTEQLAPAVIPPDDGRRRCALAFLGKFLSRRSIDQPFMLGAAQRGWAISARYLSGPRHKYSLSPVQVYKPQEKKPE